MSSRSTYSRRKFISNGALVFSGAALSYTGLSAFSFKGKEAVRIGVIGTGNRGLGLLNLLQRLPELNVVACCDINLGNLERVKTVTSSKIKLHTDYRRLLDDKNIDAVIIATPLYLHYPIAIAALDAGKHVYLEKTMTYNAEQAVALENKVKQSKSIFQVGHQYRYAALYHRVKEALDENWLGEVTHFECQYHRNSDWRFPVVAPNTERTVNWRMYKEYSGGLMAELCSHQIDIVNWMTGGHPKKVTGIGGIDFWKDGRETFDNVRTVFEYPNGVKANVSSILSNAYQGYEIRILGSKATVKIQRDEAWIFPEATKKKLGVVDGVTGATILNATQGKGMLLKFDHQDEQKRDPTSYALLDFAKCITENKKPFSNVETGKGAAIAVYMANQAMETETFQYWKPEYGG